MVNRLKPLDYVDFTGGINLRPETFQLQPNELPDLLNLEVDPRGGLNTRKSWIATSPTPITADPWDPHNAYTHRRADNSLYTYLTNGATLWGEQGNVWSNLGTGCSASPHRADFASWGDEVFVVRGWAGSAPLTVNGVVATALTASGSGNWQNDYTNPGATNTCPRAELVAQHAGYLFVAETGEDGTHYANRIRWSHPNNPKRWASDDYIDISEGGAHITAIIPFSDRLMIFKPDAVWALFGYSAETWELTNISRTVGCVNQQMIARSEAACFFTSWPHGVFGYTERNNVEELSVPIRSIFSEHRMTRGAMDNAFMGWVGRRLWVSMPWDEREINSPDCRTAFVFDPVLSCWTMFRGAEDCVPGPYIERIEIQGDRSQIAVNRTEPYLLALDGDYSFAEDQCHGAGDFMPFETRLRTRWIDAGQPTWRKSWRRPDFLLRSLLITENTINVQVFHNFDSANAERSFTVSYSPDNPLTVYGTGWVYGDGTLWGGSDQTSSVERGAAMGRAGVVQLKVSGLPSVAWGLNGIIFKYIPRRFR